MVAGLSRATISSFASCSLFHPKKGQPLLPEPPPPALLFADLGIPPSTCSKDEWPQLERGGTGQGVTFLCSGLGVCGSPWPEQVGKLLELGCSLPGHRGRGAPGRRDCSAQDPQLPLAVADPEVGLWRTEGQGSAAVPWGFQVADESV